MRLTASVCGCRLTNYLCVVGESERLAGLVSFLRTHSTDKVIVFCLTCAQVDYVYRVLTMYLPGGVPHALVSLHRKVPAPQRQVALDRFTNATSAAALLVTDVAARGIDLPDVDWVVQYVWPCGRRTSTPTNERVCVCVCADWTRRRTRRCSSTASGARRALAGGVAR